MGESRQILNQITQGKRLIKWMDICGFPRADTRANHVHMFQIRGALASLACALSFAAAVACRNLGFPPRGLWDQLQLCPSKVAVRFLSMHVCRVYQHVFFWNWGVSLNMAMIIYNPIGIGGVPCSSNYHQNDPKHRQVPHGVYEMAGFSRENIWKRWQSSTSREIKGKSEFNQ